jgi:hypothetical protein
MGVIVEVRSKENRNVTRLAYSAGFGDPKTGKIAAALIVTDRKPGVVGYWDEWRAVDQSFAEDAIKKSTRKVCIGCEYMSNEEGNGINPCDDCWSSTPTNYKESE